MILAKLLLKLGVSAAPEPLDVESDVWSVPVFVRVAPIGVAYDLEGAETPGRYLHHLGRHDRELIVELGLSGPVLVSGPVGPGSSGLERPGEPRLRGPHTTHHPAVGYGPRPLEVPGIERLHIAYPDEI